MTTAPQVQPVPAPAGSTPGGPRPAALPYAPARTSGLTGWWGLVGAVLLIGAGVLGWHDALVAWGAVGGPSWLVTVARRVGVVRPDDTVLVIGVLAVLVGLVLLVAALRPRRTTGFAVRDGGGLYLGAADLARLASATAARVDGVLDASSVVGRRSVRVTCATTGDDGTPASVQAELDAVLGHLDPAPAVSVRARRAADDRHDDDRSDRGRTR